MCSNLTNAGGYLQSPGYDYDYDGNQNCKAIVIVPEGAQIKIEFLNFIVEETDILEVAIHLISFYSDHHVVNVKQIFTLNVYKNINFMKNWSVLKKNWIPFSKCSACHEKFSQTLFSVVAGWQCRR